MKIKKPLLYPALIVMLLAGCRQREDLAQLKAINQTLQTANKIIQDDNMLIQAKLVEKKYDPTYHHYGEIWEPRASWIKKQADGIVKYIEELKNELLKQSDSLKEEAAPLIEQLYTIDGPGYDLVNRLATLKDSFPAIIRIEEFVDNPHKQARLKAEVSRLYSMVPLLPGYSDSLKADQRKQYIINWLKDNFSGTSTAMALVVLNRIENDLLATTKAFMGFCADQIDHIVCGWRAFHGVAVLNSSYVKQGQTIEVTAGRGEFNNLGNPRITIDGKEIELDGDLTAVHRFTAKGKPGKHSVMVKIEFTKPDGTLEHVSKELKYIIADEK